MYGHLVPTSGGKSIALVRERIYLGRRSDSDPDVPLSAQTAACRLRFSHGWWHAEELAAGAGLRVNGTGCSTHKVRPSDEIAVGRSRFRIQYDAPRDSRQDIDALALAALNDEPQPPEDRTPHKSNAEPSKALKPKAAPALNLPPASAFPRPKESPSPSEAIEPPPQYRRRVSLTPDFGRLIPVGGGVDHALTRTELTIGRNANCDIVIPSSRVSGTHCRLTWVDGYWRIEDLGSRNGIRIDGVRCEQGWVHPNTRLSIADLRFEIEYTPQGEPPEPGPGDPAYRKPLMEKVGTSQGAWEKLLSKHEAMEQDEPQKKRYDLLSDL